MNWLYKLERRFGRFGITNLMLYIVTTMLFVAIFDMVIGFPLSRWLALIPAYVMQGQIWRLITFIFLPPATSPLALVLSLYFYYIMGSTLERVWGTFRFNLYYLFGMVGCIIAGLITGYGTNVYLNLSLFLAFAYLFPEHKVLLFYVIPIKMKYIAYLDWALFALELLTGSWSAKAAVIASLINFFIFFGPDIVERIRRRRGNDVQRNFRNYYRNR
jgi:membrane associated rhomboid family serine protease